LTPADQQQLAPRAAVVRYGADEMVQHVGDVPARMSFIVSGRIRLTAPSEDGSVVPVGTLDSGSFLGQTALTRQAVLANAQAVGEVTVVQIAREHIEEILQRKPALLHEFGRLIEERRDQVKRSRAAVGD
jgi:CRP-like cAMP-binding protein